MLLEDWERIVSATVIDNGPIVIADYGSSQGKNSMPPMRIAIEELRKRANANKPIQVFHTDLPSNDFAALFVSLQDDPQSYMKGNTNVFPTAIGRSYFEPILPAESVNLGWNTWTAHWLSSPVLTADHVFPGYSSDEAVVQMVLDQQAEDWKKFLKCRASELKPGALMLSAFVGKAKEGTGFGWLSDHFWGAIEDMASQGQLDKDELLSMTVPVNGRTIEQIKAPFDEAGHYAGLKLVKAEIITVPDGTWAAFQSNGDAALLGITHANVVRGFTGPTIAAALGHRSDKAQVVERIYRGLAERLSASPQILEGKLAIVVLQKV